MKFSVIRRNVIFLGALAIMSLIFSRCAGTSSPSGGTTALTTATKMTTGLGSATNDIQSMGGTLATTSSFAVGGNHIVSTATSCDEHGDPGNDTNANGTVESSEKLSQSHPNYALQKFYCTLAATSTGPETVSGAVETVKVVACAIERSLGGLTFNDTPVSFSSITIDTHCATVAKIAAMGGTGTSVTMTLNGKVTAAVNPAGSNWPEVPTNNYYNHGIRIASDDGTSLKFIILAKFDDTVAGDPLESGDFEFATMGTGTLMQGTAIEYTAGKIQRTSSTAGTLWYEMRVNRIKSSSNDVLCQPLDATSTSCGFSRHTRVKGDLTFTSGDISDVANLSGVITEGYDSTGSGQSNSAFAVTAKGSLASEITGMIYTNSASPVSLTSNAQLALQFTPGTKTCILSGGAILTTGCGSPLGVDTSTTAKDFFLPSNSPTSTWIDWLSTHGGIGYSGTTSIADPQSAL